MDALNEMSQLKKLVLHSATPTPRTPFYLGRTVTLPSFTHFNISDSARDCAHALAHLELPTGSHLAVHRGKVLSPGRTPRGRTLEGIARHAYSPQGTQPLQSALIRDERKRTDIIVWPEPDIGVDVDMCDQQALLAAKRSLHASLSLLRAYDQFTRLRPFTRR